MVSNKKRFLFYLGHPAHFHLFKNVIKELKEFGHEIEILIKKKDVLEELIKQTGWAYHNINPKERADNKFSIAWNLLKRKSQFFKVAFRFKPDVMIGTSAEISHIGALLRIQFIVVNEDDADVVPLFAKLAYPLATKILAPNCCRVGKWEKKKIGYDGYHELAYLHPDYFKPDKSLIAELNPDEKYFILRFSKLGAHHDTGITGINDELALQICSILKPYGKIYITSERKLSGDLDKYRININPFHIHHALYYAQMFIGDSQTMSAESAVLGTPFIRFNDFVDRISYLDELEKKYHLGFGIKPAHPEMLLSKINELLNIPGLKEEWQRKKAKMLAEKIDVTKFFSQLILSSSAK